MKLSYEKNSEIITQWLNLCVKNLINNNLYSKKSRYLYNYIYSQIQSLPKFDKEISLIVENNLIKFNNEIIDAQFDDKIENIYDLKLVDDNDTIKLINNPRDLYIKEIKQQFNDIMDKFINSEHFKKIHSFYKAEIEENNNENIDGSYIKALFYNDLKNEIYSK